MMFIKSTFAAVVAASTLLAAATPMPTDGGSTYQCNTGSPQCCQSTATSGDPAAAKLITLLGLNVQGANVPIGLTCSPLSGVGVGNGSSCDQHPVCCSDISSSALISINCVPINISL